MKWQCYSLSLIIFFSTFVAADISLPFPKMTSAPVVEDFLSSPNHVYYCAPWGDNSIGDGSYDNPWYDLRGARGNIVPGDLIYFRGGNYFNSAPAPNGAYTNNMLNVDASEENPVVITNYPGEKVVFGAAIYEASQTYDIGDRVKLPENRSRLFTSLVDGNSHSPNDPVYGVGGSNPHWERSKLTISLFGDSQKLIGTFVEGEYGFVVEGGVSLLADNTRVSGLEVLKGASNPDGNPALVTIPTIDNYEGMKITHNYIHDSLNPTDSGLDARMAALKFFSSTNVIVEYNIFENNYDTYQYGVINFKDSTTNCTVRHNAFVNNNGGINYFAQGDVHDGLDIYGNLFVNSSPSFTFTNEAGPNIKIHDNVALNVSRSFFYYLNADPIPVPSNGEYWNNIIDGLGFEKGWHANSNDISHMPDYFDYNLWFDVSDMNGEEEWSDFNTLGYHDNSVVSPVRDFVYDDVSRTVVFPDDYSGKGVGRFGGDIGGLEFSDSASSVSVGCPNPLPEGMVFCYDFEDWTGDADTTPNYPFGEYNLPRWQSHINHTEVLSSCNDWNAYSGNYFLYGNAYEEYDACLNNIGGSRNMVFGTDLVFGNNQDFILENVLDDKMYMNFKVRLDDGWKTNTQAPVKFTRTKWLSGGTGDYSSNCVQYSGEDNWFAAPGSDESSSIDSFNLDDLSIDLSDGEWHDFSYYLDISDLREETPSGFHVIIWVDGNKVVGRFANVNDEYVLSHQPVKFYLVSFLSNFWGTEVTGSVRYAIDDIKIWDGLPAGYEGVIDPPIMIPGDLNNDEKVDWEDVVLVDFLEQLVLVGRNFGLSI